jgi:host factor-I protein
MEHSPTQSRENTTLEYSFIRELQASQTLVSVFLRNGLQLKGVITDIDKDTLSLNNNGQIQLIYKHVISTICPKVTTHSG